MRNDYFELEYRGEVAIVWLDQRDSKVNKIGPELISQFGPLLDELDRREETRAVVLISRRKDFIAGADIEAFDHVRQVGDWQPIARQGHQLLERIEQSPRPMVAAIRGACLGAGLELALACAGRIAADSETQLGLPEVKLGLLPGGGGTQRLPRLVGLRTALDMMLTGKSIYPRPAMKMGLVDRLATPDALLDAALHLARERSSGPRPAPRRRWLDRLLESQRLTRRLVFRQASRQVHQQTGGHYPAPPAIIDCVRVGYDQGLEAGLAREREQFERLILTAESFQLRGIFFAMTDKKKNPLRSQARPIDTVAMVGAGFMGAGIAQVTIPHPIRLLLKDVRPETLQKAKQTIWKDLQRKLDRRILPRLEADRQLSRLVGQLDYRHFEQAQVVIEAVFEELELKHRVLQECEAHMQPEAIFASNTSALPISEIAKASARPEQVIGMHYFSPVPKMPLLEIVVTEQTAPWVTATCYQLGLQQGKTVIVVKDGPGFYTTRILAPMLGEALKLLEEGADVLQIDAALTRFGFPVGPITLMDEVGIDVGAHIMSGRLMEFLIANRPGMEPSVGLQQMAEAGYQGRKNRKGFYRYDAKGKRVRGQLDPQMYRFFGGPRRSSVDETQLSQRIVMSFVREAIMCLQDGIISSPLDGDVGAVFGLGFPPFRGGPFRYLDQLGARSAVDRFRRLADLHGPRFEPPLMLLELATRESHFYPPRRQD